MTITSTIFSGFRHVGQNGTRLESRSNALQVISNEKKLSLRIETGSVKGIIPEIDLDPWQLEDGASLTSTTFGMVENSPTEQETGSLTFERRGRGLALTPDFSAIGSKTYELILFREGKVVWRQPGSSGVAGAINNFAARPVKACCRVLVYSGNFVVAPFTLSNGPQIDADNVFFIPENPRVQVRTINALELKGNGIETLNLVSTSVAVTDPFVTYRGIGETVVTVNKGSVSAGMEEDQVGGIAIDCGDVDRCQISLTTHTCNDTGSVKLTASSGMSTFQSEIALRNNQPQAVSLSKVSGSDADIRLDLAENSKILLKDEQIDVTAGEPGTMREVQTMLRKRVSSSQIVSV